MYIGVQHAEITVFSLTLKYLNIKCIIQVVITRMQWIPITINWRNADVAASKWSHWLLIVLQKVGYKHATLTHNRPRTVDTWIGLLLRDHFVYPPSQCEPTLQCNVVSHWLGACTKWSLSSSSVHDYNGISRVGFDDSIDDSCQFVAYVFIQTFSHYISHT